MRFKRTLLVALIISAVIAVLILVRMNTNRGLAFLQANSEYRLYASSKPFSILVNKRFPEDRSFLIVTEENPTTFSFDQSKNHANWTNLSIGTDLSVRVRSDNKNTPRQLWLLKKGENNQEELLQDLDLSGTWDIKVIPKENKRFIWIDNVWRSVDHISGTDDEPVTAKSNGINYLFNRATQAWTPE